jgi:hypothetical protein
VIVLPPLHRLTRSSLQYALKGRATEKQLMRCSHLTVVITSVVMGLLGLIFFYIGISMGWLYTLMGTLIGSGVVPVAIATSWKKANKWGCCVGAVGGLAVGLIAWLVTTAKLNDGVINITTTGQDYPLLAGNIGALVTGAVVSIVWSLISPENFDFDITRAMNFAPIPAPVEVQPQTPIEYAGGDDKDIDEKAPTSSARIQAVDDNDNEGGPQETSSTGDIPELDYVGLNKALRLATWSSVIISLILLIIVPMPLFGSSYIWSEKGFVGWIVITLAWSFAAGIAIILYPLWESRSALGGVFRGIGRDLTGKPPASQF